MSEEKYILRPFTAHEVRLLRERYVQEGTKNLANELGRSRRSISTKARKLGLVHSAYKIRRHAAHHEWTPEEDLVLRRRYPETFLRKRPGHLTAGKLASMLNVPLSALRTRVAALGLSRVLEKGEPWTEAEDEYLLANAHLAVKTLAGKMRARGWTRSPNSICSRRSFLGARVSRTGHAYTLRELAELMGVSHVVVQRWIRLGYLRAGVRGDTLNACGGPGDRYAIQPCYVYDFIAAHPTAFHLLHVDQLWLIDLLTTRGYRDAGKIQRQESCGIRHSAAGGYDEHEVRV